MLNRNRYLVFEGDAVTTIKIVADTHLDAMVCDKLAIGPATSRVTSSTWGRVKSLYR